MCIAGVIEPADYEQVVVQSLDSSLNDYLATIPPGAGGYFPGPPDLAIEVVSPSDTHTEVEAKIADWLAAGCQVVVVLDPRRCLATVHRRDDDVISLGLADSLVVTDLLPGWSLRLAEVFGPDVSG